MAKLNELTEEQLYNYIKTIVNEQVEKYKNKILFEMPYPRGTYKEKIDSLFPQLLTNWCLVRYRTITNTEPYKKHWQGKLYGFMLSIARFCLRGNDSIETRKKVFDEIIYENDYLKVQFLRLTICAKFDEENINVDTKECTEAIQDCIKSIPIIVNLLLSRDYGKMKEYCLQI